MRFVVLGYDEVDERPATSTAPPEEPAPGAGARASSALWAALSPSSAATTVRDGVLTPGAWPGTDPRLSSVCVLDARDLDAVVDLVRGLPGVVEIRPAEAR
ncbi:hypothetical protein IC607_03495 [Cellulomonas sp. JH27-2]|uniref:hypothetical protein n=1 Tax=Cellulomonas sp. JH27-2 TaxID=2774139 RepID=UPI00177DDC1D|nr:hypothetical protein [Cellulomonas sp. JH27-2]MBD8058029.1 hypothetical protein [Cellulomonas sp. JH27-2]